MEKRAAKNVIFGLLNQAINIAFGLILPRMFILSYGSEVNGLLATVNHMFACLALLEAGVGRASLQALYGTVAVQNNEASNKVLSATDRFYRKTGTCYFLLVLALSFSYPLIVRSGLTYWTIFFVILLSGLAGVVNFFFQGKFRILLMAEGKNYLLYNLGTCIYILTNITKIILMKLGYGIVLIQTGYLMISLIEMAYIMLYIKSRYKWVDLSVVPNNDALAGKDAVLVHQVSALVFNNTDSIVLSLTSGLKVVSVYSLYNSLYNAINGVLCSFLDGFQFALGQTYHSDFRKFKEMQERFESLYIVLTFLLYSILYILVLPFIHLYTAGVKDVNYVDPLLPFLFALACLLQGARGPMQAVTEYAEHFRQTQHQALIETIINLSVTIFLTNLLGIYGALAGTIVALLYRVNAIILYTNHVILKRSPAVTYKRWGWCAGIFGAIVTLNRFFVTEVTTPLVMLVLFIPVSIFCGLLYFCGMLIFERDTVVWLKSQVLRKLGRNRWK